MMDSGCTHRVTHPFPLGAEVAIIRIALSGRPVLEGRAIVQSFTNIPNRYKVRFVGENVVRERFAFSILQDRAEALVDAIGTIWLHDVLAEPSHDEFFPDHRRF